MWPRRTIQTSQPWSSLAFQLPQPGEHTALLPALPASGCCYIPAHFTSWSYLRPHTQTCQLLPLFFTPPLLGSSCATSLPWQEPWAALAYVLTCLWIFPRSYCSHLTAATCSHRTTGTLEVFEHAYNLAPLQRRLSTGCGGTQAPPTLCFLSSFGLCLERCGLQRWRCRAIGTLGPASVWDCGSL